MELPSSFYNIVGFLIITNLSAIGSLLYVGFKATWWAAVTTNNIEEAKKSAVRAHKRIDTLEDK